jgi:NitT/TauT family transport system permease protein
MLVIFAGWEAVGSFRLAGLSWPPLTAVLYLADSTRTPLFVRAVDATLAAVVGDRLSASRGCGATHE